MGNGVTMIKPWERSQQLIDGIDGQVLSRIAVAMHVNVDAPCMKWLQHLLELFWNHQQLPMI